MSGDKDFIYDEDESVKFIQNYLPQELKGKFSNDDINYIVDLIYEFYESKGCMSEDIDDDTEIEIDEDELTALCSQECKTGWSREVYSRRNHLYCTRRDRRIANHWICLNK